MMQTKPSLRILILNWWDRTALRAGGAELHLHQIFGRIAQLGHDVTLLCCRFPGVPATATLDGIHIIRRGTARTLNLLAPFWVRQHAGAFDVVIDYTNKIPFFTPLYAPLPRLSIAHHINGVAFRREFRPLPAAVLMGIERAIFRRVYRRETFTAVSPSTAAELIDLGIEAERVHVIHNGADHLATQATRPPSDGPLLLYVGRLKRYKNLDAVLRGLARLRADLPGVRLAIVGRGDQRRALETLVDTLGLSGHVIFSGRVDDVILADWFSKAWVAVNLSVKEGWGLGIIEAAGYGVPAVAADVPGLRDAVVDGETGLLVPPDDEAALAEALRQLCTDAPYRRMLGDNARQRAAQFRWADAAVQTLEVIKALVEEKM